MVAQRIVIVLLVATGLATVAWAQNPNVVPYASQTPQVQATVKAFARVPDDVPKPTDIIRLPTGEIDHRNPTERYLNPNHPGVQPRPDVSSYRRYLGVPNVDNLPIHQRPAMEDPKNRFLTLPKIIAPPKIPITYNITPEGIYPKRDPFSHPPGTNFLPTVFQDARDGFEQIMENTLPSTRSEPYHLQELIHRPIPIDANSPTDDLGLIFDRVYQTLTGTSPRRLWENLDGKSYEEMFNAVGNHRRKIRENAEYLRHHLEWAIDIIEGNPVPGRAYSGFPLLHHSGYNRIRRVKPILGEDGKVKSGNVNVHQIWYDQRIENDTMYLDFGGHPDSLDPDLPPIPEDVPWTITYTIDVLNRGSDDFATTTMFFDSPEAAARYASHQSTDKNEQVRKKEQDQLRGYLRAQFGRRSASRRDATKAHSTAKALPPPLPHIAMDETFFPMDSGTRTILKIKMPPNKYYNLTYTWGWRVHPPRAQAMENVQKTLPNPNDLDDPSKNIPIIQPERVAFAGLKNPIDAIGDLAPAKRMWRAFNSALNAVANPEANATEEKRHTQCLGGLLDARNAYLDWKDRTHLPSGLRPDKHSDLTLLYVNNTIYGELTGGGFIDLPKWRERPTPVRITLINGDYFDHGYLNVNFGGNRGWENQFKSSIQVAGSGPFFTFGRFHWRFNTNPGTISVQAAEARKGGEVVKPGELRPDDVPDSVMPGTHRLWIEFNHEPSRRLRFYQFDPAHHDVAIYSIH